MGAALEFRPSTKGGVLCNMWGSRSRRARAHSVRVRLAKLIAPAESARCFWCCCWCKGCFRALANSMSAFEQAQSPPVHFTHARENPDQSQQFSSRDLRLTLPEIRNWPALCSCPPSLPFRSLPPTIPVLPFHSLAVLTRPPSRTSQVLVRPSQQLSGTRSGSVITREPWGWDLGESHLGLCAH